MTLVRAVHDNLLSNSSTKRTCKNKFNRATVLDGVIWIFQSRYNSLSKSAFTRNGHLLENLMQEKWNEKHVR